MKKFLFGILLSIFMLGAAQQTLAQLNFFNNTACPVRVQGVFTNSTVPCTIGPYCNSPWIAVPPFGAGVLPGGPCPFAPAPPSNFVKIQINFGAGFFGTSICGGGPTGVIDCTGAFRTLQMFSFTSAAVF